MIGATNAPLWNKDIGGAGTSQSVVSVLSLSGGSRKWPKRNNPVEEGTGSSAVVAYLEKVKENQAALLACLNDTAHDRNESWSW